MKRAFTLIELLVVLAIIGIMAAILFPIFRTGHSAPRSACQSNLKQISLGMMQYVQDYDERYPSHSLQSVSSSVAPFSSPYGWADALQPYVKNTPLFQCPSERETLPANDATQSGFTDYWMNSNLARVQTKNIQRPAQTLMFGDGNDAHDGSDARYNRNVIPQFWIEDENSPANRHIKGANYAFADGHVKWFKSQKMASETALRSGISFELR